MTIQTKDELLDYIETNFDKLSNKAYINVCSAMHIYQYRKPETKQMALKRINELCSLAQKYQSAKDLPFSLN